MRKTPFLHEFVRKRKLAREADAAEQLRLRRQHAGEQKEPFEQLLFACEGHGQQAGTEQNAIGEVDGRSIRQDDLDSAGGGFGFEFDNATDDGVMPALLDRDRRVGDHSFEPADQVALLDGEFAADANGADPVHEVDGLSSFTVAATSHSCCENLSGFLRQRCLILRGKWVGPEEITLVEGLPKLPGDLVFPGRWVELNRFCTPGRRFRSSFGGHL